MKSKRAAVRQFGQLSLPSSFHSNSIPSSKDRKDDTSSKPLTSCISLSDFLDRKLDKATQNLIQEKQKSFSTVAIGPVNEHMGLKREESGSDFLLNRAVFQQFKHKLNEGDCVRSSGGGELGVFELELTEDSEDSRKRKNPFAVSRGGDERDSHQGRLVVLGDDPKPKQRGKGNMFTSKRPKNLFNHLAGGTAIWRELTVKKLVAVRRGKEWGPPPWEDWNGINLVNSSVQVPIRFLHIVLNSVSFVSNEIRRALFF